MKRPRKIALISVFDYPRNDYSAYWIIHRPEAPSAGGWQWSAHIHAYEPIAWTWRGERHAQRPDAPMPAVFAPGPSDIAAYRALIDGMYAKARNALESGTLYSVLPPDVPVRQEEFLRLDAVAQREVAALQDLRREVISLVAEMHPQPVYLLEEDGGIAENADAADEAAQNWVLARMPKYRRARSLRAYSDDEIAAMVSVFDAARAAHNFGEVDRIRGLLKSHGIALAEGSTIDYPAPTAWHRI